jgi:hypothetical protein
MKQAHNLTAGTIISGTFCWSSIIKPTRISFRGLKEKINERATHYRSLFITLATIALIGGLFLSGSYLFFIQLAKHGW